MIFNQCCLNLRLIPGFDDQLALLAGHPSVGPLQMSADQRRLRRIGALRALNLPRWGLLPGILCRPSRLIALVFSL